jgi:uncharacterized protein
MSIGKEVCLLFAVLFLPGMIAQTGDVAPEAFENVLYHIQVLVVSIPQVLLVVALGDLRRPGSSKAYGFRRPERRDITATIIALLASWAAVSLVSAVLSLLGVGGETMEPGVRWTFDRRELIPLAFLSTMAIGYREEIFFRAFIADRAEEAGTDPRIALAAAAVVFALGHLYQGVLGFVVSLTIGLVLAAVYLRTRSLHGISIAHGLYNLVVLLAAGAA